MSEMQKEIYRHSEYFRAWKDKKFLSEVQKRKSEAAHLYVYYKDKPEKLMAGRRRSSREGLTNARNGNGGVFRRPHL
jgi:hypothetical protein